MKERPILFSAEMVRAILDGRKTQTRRVIKPQPSEYWHPDPVGTYAPTCVDKHGEEYPGEEVYGASDEYEGRIFPYGVPGDVLWVKETCFIWGRWAKNGLTAKGRQRWRFKGETPHTVVFDAKHPQVATRKTPRETCMYWRRPSIFMPRWASRITLEITDVRVQPVQEISVKDCRAEGITLLETNCAGECGSTPCSITRQPFTNLWDSINAKRGFGWEKNPWVWALTFRRLA